MQLAQIGYQLVKAVTGRRSGDEVLEEVYSKLILKRTLETFEFNEKTWSHRDEKGIKRWIAEDSDHHKQRVGFFRYESASVIELGDNFWVVGNGESFGDYPADAYGSDILALPLAERPKDLESYVRDKIEGALRTQASMVYTERSGINYKLTLPFLSGLSKSIKSNLEERQDGKYELNDNCTIVPTNKDHPTPMYDVKIIPAVLISLIERMERSPKLS